MTGVHFQNRTPNTTGGSAGVRGGVGLVLARAYGSEAIALARTAVAKGLVDATPPRSDPDCDPLRDRDEFHLLLDELKVRKK